MAAMNPAPKGSLKASTDETEATSAALACTNSKKRALLARITAYLEFLMASLSTGRARHTPMTSPLAALDCAAAWASCGAQAGNSPVAAP